MQARRQRPSTATYTVRSGDTLSGIAATELGSAARHTDIFQANRDQLEDPNLIRVGQVLQMPGMGGGEQEETPFLDEATDEVEQQQAPEPTSSGGYTVQGGDSMWAIAANLTGDGSRWRELFEANRDTVADASQIRRGQVLRLPAGWGEGNGGQEQQGPSQTPDGPQQDQGPQQDGGDPELQEQGRRQLGETVYESLSKWEGGNPTLVHYDSGRVNLGKGSWNGGHITRLMELYLQVAAENNMVDTLYGYFGGKGAYEAVHDRFRRHGAATVISTSEENAFRAVGGDRTLALAQDRKGGEDVQRYIDQMANLSEPWPWLQGGKISERSAVVLAAAGHQSGSVSRAFDAVRGGRTSEQLAQQYSEQGFLDAVADLIVSWVEPRYQTGVRNRYNDLMTYSASAKYAL